MTRQMILATALFLGACSSAEDNVQPGKWNCENLIKPIMEMSQEKESKIIEITGASKLNDATDSIECRGRAEWTKGDGSIKYGARVSEGNRIVLEYEQEPY